MKKMPNVQETLVEMALALASLANGQSGDHTAACCHDERQQGNILLAWERLAALTGNGDLPAGAGLEMPGDLAAMPVLPARTRETREIRKALGKIREAADRINDHRALESGDTAALREHNEARKDEMRLAWERIAILTGYGMTVLLEGGLQPEVPFHTLRHAPLYAMGIMALHGQRALQEYAAARAETGETRALERHSAAEREALLAHRLAWLLLQEAAGNRHENTIRGFCQDSHRLIERTRRAGMRALGLRLPRSRKPELLE